MFFLLFYDSSQSKEITVVFRNDDYNSKSDFVSEQAVIEEFSKHDIPCTFGVIPFIESNFSSEVVEILQKAINEGTVEVALHGYTHEFISERNRSEFVDVPYDSQYVWIKRGKKLLEELWGISIEVFIPPNNSYDENTVFALENNNINTISANTAISPYQSESLSYLPYICKPNGLKKFIEISREIPEEFPIIIVCLHTGEISEDGFGEIGS